MKDNIPDTVPHKGLDEEQADVKKLLTKSEKDGKDLPKRTTLESKDVFISKAEQEHSWGSLRTLSLLQGLVVLLMLMVQLIAVDYVDGRIYSPVAGYVSFFWVSITFASIATGFTLLVTVKHFRTACLIATALLYQYCLLFTWFIFFILRVAMASSDRLKVYESERFLVELIFVINFAAAVASVYSVKMLCKVGGYQLLSKMLLFYNRYGDLVDLDDEDFPHKYNLV